MTVSEERFWELAAPLENDPAVRRSTMMGLPCLRHGGRFFASFDRRGQTLLIKLDQRRVAELVDSGTGQPFAPAGRVFREWAAIPDPGHWAALLEEARAFAADPDPPAAPGFAGFGAAGFAFLAELEHHNSREFFDRHREVYGRDLLAPSMAFVVALGQRLSARISTGLRAEPRVGGSLFRINQDRRFAPDKPPYKPYVDILFWEGPEPPRANPALILRLSASSVELGAGVTSLTGLDHIVTELTTAGARLSEPTRTRVPRGWDPDGPAARFVVRDGFHLTRTLPRPTASTTARFVDWCANRLNPFANLHRWLVDGLGERDQA